MNHVYTWYLFLIAIHIQLQQYYQNTFFPNTLWHIILINSSQSHFGNKRVHLALAYHLVYWHYTLRLYWSNSELIHLRCVLRVEMKIWYENIFQVFLPVKCESFGEMKIWNENMIGIFTGKMDLYKSYEYSNLSICIALNNCINVHKCINVTLFWWTNAPMCNPVSCRE